MGCAIDTANAEWRRIKKYRFDAVLLFDASRKLPKWVKSGHSGRQSPCPLYPQKRRSLSAIRCPVCAKSRCLSLHGVHNVRASAKEVADVICGYPEVICGTMVARQIFDKLLTLLASITRDAEPVDSTVEHHANRTAYY